MDESLVAKYPELERSHFWWRTRRNLIGRLISSQPIQAPTILDVGCGSGVTASMLATSGSAVVGIDLDPEQLSTAVDGFQYRCGDFLDLSADLGQFDVVLALDAVEHFEDEAEVLQAIYANTRPGGEAIVTVPAYDWLWSSHDEENRHYRRYTRKRLRNAMLDAGFTVERIGYIFGALVIPKALVTVVERRSSRQLPVASVPGPTWNRGAGAYFRAETELALRLRNFLPFGTSVVAVASRPKTSSHLATEERR